MFLVPYRASPERDLLWNHCAAYWKLRVPEFPLFIGESPPGPFNRAAAVNDAAARAEPWDVAIVLDADVLADPWQVRIAANTAYTTGEVVLGFTTYHGLTPAATRRVLAGEEEPSPQGRIVTKRQHESSIVCIPRSAWAVIGGFDEEFVGWGQEDVAFAQSARVLVGLRRVPGDVYHLYHDRTKERLRTRDTYRANQLRGKAYRGAATADELAALRGGR